MRGLSRVALAMVVAVVMFCGSLSAAQVSDIQVYSKSMDKDITCSVVTPDGYDKGQEYPVVYLLHGYSNNNRTWVDKFDSASLSDQYDVIIVAPDGRFDSWYWDSPIDPTSRYETFVSGELVEYIDSHYSTIPSREGRAITGLSMGGHGALYLAFRNSDTYGAVGSMSGGVDIRPFPKNWNMEKSLGSQAQNPQYWQEYTVMGQLHNLVPDKLEIWIDCGTEDFFYDVNEKLHEELLYRKIPHSYLTRKGGHNLPYWRVSLSQQLLFFDTYFNREK